MQSSQKIDLMGFSFQQLRSFFEALGEKPFWALQLFQWVHQRGVTDFSLMTDMSKLLRSQLEEIAEVRIPSVVCESRSTDGTWKALIDVGGSNQIETVFIPEESRGTLCISSQVGCMMNCAFCATATQGFNRNLTTAEIIGQLWVSRFRYQHPITNVVMMGMGEPLLNYEELIPALAMMRHDHGYGLSRRRVTVSTSGVVPNITRLAQESDVALAVSLHAPTDELRSQLVPMNRKYPIAQLLDACCAYVAPHKRDTVTIEYIMLADVNDTLAHAKALCCLLKGMPCKVNLIPFNPFVGSVYKRSTSETIEKFREQLVRSGIVTITRKSRGEDIKAACGQLKGEVFDKTRRQERFLKMSEATVCSKVNGE